MKPLRVVHIDHKHGRIKLVRPGSYWGLVVEGLSRAVIGLVRVGEDLYGVPQPKGRGHADVIDPGPARDYLEYAVSACRPA
jgi:hypothetical protein